MGDTMPKTLSGKYALRFVALFAFFLILAQIIIMTGQRGGDTFFGNLWISIPMMLAFLSAILAFCFGTISIVRDKERSPFVIVASLMGFLVLIFLLGEFLFPH